MSNGKVTISVGNGLSFCSILFLVFLVLKLCSVITWSWWWITAPLWLPTAAVIAVLIVVFGGGSLFLWLFVKWRNRAITNKK